MALEKIKITDSAISTHVALPSIKVLRDTQNPLLQLRFKANRCIGVWRILYRNKWLKVGEWPETKTRDIRNSFSVLISKIRDNQEAKVTKDCFITIGDLLTWYKDRMADNANLSDQRKKDIKSSVKCHLMPRLGAVNLLDLDKNLLDKRFVWPLQKELAKSSVVKKFHMLKAAFTDAYDLDLLPNHPMATMKISDFGDFSEDAKESLLKPRMVPALLDEMSEQQLYLKMVCMLMLTLGTRIGETLAAKWRNINLTFDPAWDIPKQDTKTKKAMTIHLPAQVVQLLKQWKAYQKSCRYNGPFLFPHPNKKDSADYNVVQKDLHAFSSGEWCSHDLRKCARICWEEQGVDGLVAERMLNHELGKTTRAYTGKAFDLRFSALKSHCLWLEEQKENCFILNPRSTLTGDCGNGEVSLNAA